MARQIIQRLIDDLDGGDASETVSFAIDGRNYTIDLSEKNAGVLRKVLAPYVAAGTRAGRGTGPWRPGLGASTQRTNRADNKALRDWAVANGHDISARGRIPQSVVDAYEAAKNAPAATAEKVARRPRAQAAADKGGKGATRKKTAAAKKAAAAA